MEKRRFYLTVLICVFLILGSISFASANTFGNLDYRFASEQIIQTLKEIFGPFLESIIGTGEFDEFFWAKILFLILFYVVTLMVLKRSEIFRGNNALIIIVSITVSILAVRFIRDSDFMRGLLLPYGVLAVTLSILIPFLIFFFFVHKSEMSETGRKIVWILFLLVFIVLWLSRASMIDSSLNWIYGLGLILLFLCVFFDKKIHIYFELSGLQNLRNRHLDRQMADIEVRMHNLRQVQNPSDNITKEINFLEKRQKELTRQRS